MYRGRRRAHTTALTRTHAHTSTRAHAHRRRRRRRRKRRRRAPEEEEEGEGARRKRRSRAPEEEEKDKARERKGAFFANSPFFQGLFRSIAAAASPLRPSGPPEPVMWICTKPTRADPTALRPPRGLKDHADAPHRSRQAGAGVLSAGPHRRSRWQLLLGALVRIKSVSQ